jgi:purine-binding chemotaxis protein CheW
MLATQPPSQVKAVPQIFEHSVGRSDRLVVFQLGCATCAIDLDAVQEITLMAHLTIPSGLPTVLAGFLNLGQRAIPVIRLHRLFDVPEPAHGLYTQILIFRETHGLAVGWIVDRVTQIITAPQSDIMPVPENQCFKDCATGAFNLNEANVTILSPDRVLLEKERQSIREFAEIEQARLRELEAS